MSTVIYFKNYDDEQISHQQSSLVQEFKKEYKIDNKIKKIEHYQNGILKDIDYFKDSSETLLNIFEILAVNTVNIITFDNYNNYVVQTEDYYIKGNLSTVEKKLFLNNNLICQLFMDKLGKIDHLFSHKYLYNEKNEEVFSFTYKEDGTLNYIGGIDYPFSNENQYLYSDEISLYFPNLLIDNPYYLTSNFLPPLARASRS